VSDELILAALSRLEAGQTALREEVSSLRADVSRLEAGQTALREGVSALRGEVAFLRGEVASLREEVGRLAADQAALRADFARLEAAQTSLRVDCMARMDRLENGLTDIRNDIAVNFGATDAVKRANDNTREELRALGDVVSAMYRQIKALEARVRDITGEP
jgi:chromosome segregation ATPase